MKRCGSWLLLIVLALAMLPVPTQAQTASGFGRFHALVIGCQNYKHLKPLQTPLADAEAVAQVLQDQYGFTVKLLRDETREAIIAALFGLRSTMGEEDSLLIYYAGHGEEDRLSETGYWQPTDAAENPANWISVDDINSQLKAIRAKHVLIIADSCYAGKLLTRDSDVKFPSAASRAELLRRMQAKRSLTALTSGGKEPVKDGGGGRHSVFAKALLDVLRDNKERFDGSSLFEQIRWLVILNAEQTPQYGDIRIIGGGHEGGDFIFVPKEIQESGVQQIESGAKTDLSFLERSADSAATPPPAMDNISVSRKKLPSLSPQNTWQPLENLPKKLAPQKGKTIGQYIDHGDGTVTDTKTGLMWKRCSEGLSGVNCENGKTESYIWDGAVQRFKDVEYAGYSDWRMPTVDELKTLVYCSKGKNQDDYCNDDSERPTINQQAFPNTEATYFWSEVNSTYAGRVGFYDGDSGISNYGSSYAVRLVRGGDSTATPPIEKTVAKQPSKKQLKQGDIMTDPTTGMEFIYVPGGCFMMGSPENDKEHQNDEGPIHKICVDGFWMGKYEVTQGQWMKIMDNNPANFKKGDDYPVENVSWNDAQKFIEKLNSKSGKQFRLPTEAEWEYACRAGGTGKYCGGDDVDAVAWYSNNSGGISHKVGGKKKNSFGLYDMSGNVWEWCMDWYEDGYYAVSSKDNPLGPSNGSFRVIRGGGWFHTHREANALNRRNNSPGYRDNSHGFRLVLPL